MELTPRPAPRAASRAALLSAALVGAALPALAAAQDAPLDPAFAAGTEVFVSSDSEGSQTYRIAADFDLRNRGEDRRLGFRLEQAWYDPRDTGTRSRQRAFVRAADVTGNWKLAALVGTDGDTAIGSLSAIEEVPFRKEFFVERDIVETPRGIDEGIYSTFAGAGLDIPLARTTTLAVMGGVQDFTGDNTRLHARATFVQVVDEDNGISLQLRGRYFHNSTPREFDYYSPRWYAQVLPVAQVRRFVDGWELVGVAGVGVQRDNTANWKRADYAQVRVRAPRGGDWQIGGDVTYSNTPGTQTLLDDGGYRYVQGRLSVLRRF